MSLKPLLTDETGLRIAEAIRKNTASNQKLTELETRMNQFTTHPEGSTTGDAELMDGRVSRNGEVYANIGDHIRGETGKLSEEIDAESADLARMTLNEVTPIIGQYANNWVRYSDGVMLTNNDYDVSNPIEIPKSAKKFYYTNRTPQENYIAAFVFSGNIEPNFPIYHIQRYLYTTGDEPAVYDIPDGSKYLFICTTKSKVNGNERYYFDSPYDIVPDEYDNPVDRYIINIPTSEELRVYHRALHENTDIMYDISVPLGNDTESYQEDNSTVFKCTTIKNVVYRLGNYSKNCELLWSKDFDVTYLQLNPTNKKVLVMGDSTVYSAGLSAQGVQTQKMLDRFAEKGVNLSLIGTMGEGANKWEGRPGWTISDHRTKSSENAFYNPNKSDFDFAYYLSNNGLETPDYVVIQLGINDVFDDFADIHNAINKAVTDLAFIINDILSVNSGIKVLYNLVFPPKDEQAWFGASYKLGVKRFQAHYNYIKFNEYVIKNIRSLTSGSRVLVVPTNLVLDTTDMLNGVHPNEGGYEKLAKMDCNYLWFN